MGAALILQREKGANCGVWDMLAFKDRAHAGRELAAKLGDLRDLPDLRVLALPRGGVPVAFEVARALHAPLDVLVIRKLGVPGQEELALGAIATGNVRVLNEDLVGALQIDDAWIDAIAAREGEELERRERAYRGDLPVLDIRGCTVVLIDDGLATGASMRAAIVAVREREPRRIVVAVPVGPADTCMELRHEVDDVVCASIPQAFHGVGQWYENFTQTSDEEVRTLLARAARERGGESTLPRARAPQRRLAEPHRHERDATERRPRPEPPEREDRRPRDAR
jgi:putative phosphoribosyl transferase